jgi:hypothetical protein
MKKYIIVVTLLLCSALIKGQTAYDLFDSRQTEITYLGIDFSQVKLIGNFSEFMEAGNRNVMEIRDKYFGAWNRVVVNERDKFDIGGMLRKSEVFYDIEMITMINSRTNLEEMEALNCGKFTLEQIQEYVSTYDLSGKKGIGVVFIAECLNKSAVEAVFHLVAINMESGKVIFQRRLKGEPNGFGLRNYWINSLNKIIENVTYFYYGDWKQTADELKGQGA